MYTYMMAVVRQLIFQLLVFSVELVLYHELIGDMTSSGGLENGKVPTTMLSHL